MKSKKLAVLLTFYLVPLLCIGAFFLPLSFKIFTFFALFLLLFFSGLEKILDFIKFSFFSILFLLPFFFIMLFNFKEGKVFKFYFWSIYSDGLFRAMNYLFFVLLLSIISFYVLKVIFSFRQLKELNFWGVTLLFKVFEFYEILISEIVFSIPKLSVKFLVDLIERKYIDLKRKNVFEIQQKKQDIGK